MSGLALDVVGGGGAGTGVLLNQQILSHSTIECVDPSMITPTILSVVVFIAVLVFLFKSEW